MTLEAWVYPTSVTNKWRDVIYKGNDNYYLHGDGELIVQARGRRHLRTAGSRSPAPPARAGECVDASGCDV